MYLKSDRNEFFMLKYSGYSVIDSVDSERQFLAPSSTLKDAARSSTLRDAVSYSSTLT